MDKKIILEKLQQIFRDVIETEDLIIEESMNMTDVKGWDSLSHINVIDEIEKEFNIHLSIGEIVTLKTISDMIVLIQNKLK